MIQIGHNLAKGEPLNLIRRLIGKISEIFWIQFFGFLGKKSGLFGKIGISYGTLMLTSSTDLSFWRTLGTFLYPRIFGEAKKP